MKPTDVLLPANVLCNVEASSKKHAIEVVAKLIARDRETLAENDIFTSLIDRERLGCTALENGLAVPHARVEGLTEPAAGLIKLSSPVEFDKSDDTDVDLVFGLVVPLNYEDESGGFRELVATLGEPDRLTALRSARSSRELFAAAVDGSPGADTPDDGADDVVGQAAAGSRAR